MSDTKLTNSAECAPPHWAIVAWNRAGEGLLFDADTKTKDTMNDWGVSDHWWQEHPSTGVWRWEGTMRWDSNGEDFALNGEWKQIWSLVQR